MNRFVQLSILVSVGITFHSYTFSQETAKVIQNDSLKSAITLEAIVVSQDSNTTNTPGFKALPSQRTDEVVEQLQGVSLIRRGNYAAEPTFRGMSSGQLSITIDGMKIFGACTDKMDPVSSYVSANNLESITVSSNSNHTCQGANIGGGFDFQTKAPKFDNSNKWSGSAGIGYETNGNGRKVDFNLNYGDSVWAVNLNANYQKFDNYFAGGGNDIKYTQFENVNFALSASWMFSSTQILKAQLIYDDAYNVGYPALPMDVSFAGGRIYSISYKQYLNNGSFLIKAYGNNITHIMDDTQREFVPIHMDMPGWSDTYGVFAKLKWKAGNKHTLTINPDYYQNKSFADMKMYPNDPSRPNEPVMYMITWPDVLRHSGSVLLSDKFEISDKTVLNYSGKTEYVSSKIQSEFGLKQLKAIGQDGSQPSAYWLTNGEVNISHTLSKKWTVYGQLGYAERQPTVSEGFGYYLFNSMDAYDYIGRVDLRKEKAVKASLGIKYYRNKTTFEGQVYHYQFQDYIIGIVDTAYDGMTIGSNGVKVYHNIPSASISGVELKINTTLFKVLKVQNNTQYSYGIDNENEPLQLIPPLQNTTILGMEYENMHFRIEAIVAAVQNNPRIDVGETSTPSYGLLNFHAEMPFTLFGMKTNASVGVKNILDSHYWDHLDWNSIPRPGRSFVCNIRMQF